MYLRMLWLHALQDASLDGAMLYAALVSDQATPMYRKELVLQGCTCRMVYDIMQEAEVYVSGQTDSGSSTGGNGTIVFPLCPQLLSGALLTTYNAMAVSTDLLRGR